MGSEWLIMLWSLIHGCRSGLVAGASLFGCWLFVKCYDAGHTFTIFRFFGESLVLLHNKQHDTVGMGKRGALI